MSSLTRCVNYLTAQILLSKRRLHRRRRYVQWPEREATREDALPCRELRHRQSLLLSVRMISCLAQIDGGKLYRASTVSLTDGTTERRDTEATCTARRSVGLLLRFGSTRVMQITTCPAIHILIPLISQD